jgi:putative Ca2+/H+ antiporter (TMEM165/GDT1 family)
MLEVFLTTYGAVFVAEIVGDKLLYASGVLATRYRWSGMIIGMSLAFMVKMSVAVAAGSVIGSLLPRWLVGALTVISYVGVAVAMWRKPDIRGPAEKDTRILNGAAVAFSTIVLCEWGDKGMTTASVWAASWASQAQSSGGRSIDVAAIVWAGAVLAMVTKGGLAVTLGASVRQRIVDHVQPRYVRFTAVAALMGLGVLSVLEILGKLVD